MYPNTTRLYWFFTEGTYFTCMCAPPRPLHTHFLAPSYATVIVSTKRKKSFSNEGNNKSELKNVNTSNQQKEKTFRRFLHLIF